MSLTQPKTDLAYLRNEKAKAEQKLRAYQHREKILERQMSELNRRSGDGTAENLIPSTGSRAGSCKDGA